MNNRKARLLLRVPSNVCGNFEGYKVSNRITLIFFRGKYRKTHLVASRSWKRREAAERRAREKFLRERDEDLALWKAAGFTMDPARYTGRVTY